MARILMAIMVWVGFGLMAVYGEVEALKVGYDIRQLSIQKYELTHSIRDRECKIAGLTVPQNLEDRLDHYRVKLAKTPRLKVARALSDKTTPSSESGARLLLARVFMGSAEARPGD
ncbi:MAG: hypothetical protein HQL11_02005 [Candidatus Omnitrophica bacterium]|nr:hypothetical protein [Candidatus Omnitrophota bacterium]